MDEKFYKPRQELRKIEEYLEKNKELVENIKDSELKRKYVRLFLFHLAINQRELTGFNKPYNFNLQYLDDVFKLSAKNTKFSID